MPVLAGKVVIVTGGARGIGRAIAFAAAAEGARVVVADYGGGLHGGAPEPAITAAVAQEINAQGGEALAATESVTTMEGARHIVNAAMTAWGRVEGLVCCAGILRHRPFLELTEQDFDEVIAAHLKGHFTMFQTALKAMVQCESKGSMIGICSGYVQGDPARAPYRAAKAGVIALTKSVALAATEHGVRANVISPLANTRMTEASKLKFDSDPEDVAPMAVYLLSDRSRGLNGEVFTVAGNTISTWREPYERRTARHHARWAQADIEAAMPWLRDDPGAARPPVMPPLPPGGWPEPPTAKGT